MPFLQNSPANLRNWAKAIALYQQSLAIQEQIGNVQGKAATLANIADLQVLNADFDGAVINLEESLAILQHIGSYEAAAVEQKLEQCLMLREMMQAIPSELQQMILGQVTQLLQSVGGWELERMVQSDDLHTIQQLFRQDPQE